MQPVEFFDIIKKKYPDPISANDSFHRLLDVKIGEDGGVRAYFEGMDEPLRHYPEATAIFVTTTYKRLFVLLAENFSTMSWGKKMVTLLALNYNKAILSSWLNYVFENSHVLLQDQHYCQVAKEVRRVLKKYVPSAIADAVGMILEYDTAYCYRFQDIAVLYRKNHPIRTEILALFDIMRSRETQGNLQEKWGRVRRMLSVLLLLPNIRKLCKEVMDELNLQEIQFSKEDLYWANKFSGYRYLGKTNTPTPNT